MSVTLTELLHTSGAQQTRTQPQPQDRQGVGLAQKPASAPTRIPKPMFIAVYAIPEADPDYTVLEDLYEGRVYLVENKKNNEVYVAKVLKAKEKMETNQELLDKINKCPYIVKYIRVLHLALGHTCIMMEYCRGGSLAGWISKKKTAGEIFSNDEICMVLLQVGRGLLFLHQRYIAHRDVKPSNILLGEDQIFKLGDFGFASLMKRSKSQRVSLVGTDGYIAPEVYKGKGYGVSADVFSFGVVLYEMLMLKSPFDVVGDDGALHFSREKAGLGEIPSMNSANYNPELIALVHELLATDVHERITMSQALQKKVIIEFVHRTNL